MIGMTKVVLQLQDLCLIASGTLRLAVTVIQRVSVAVELPRSVQLHAV